MSSKRQAHKTSTKSTSGAGRKRSAAKPRAAKAPAAKARAAKQVTATLKGLPSRTARLVKSHPVRVALGAAAMGLAVAKLKSLV